jgi:hypothetical protein
MSKREDLAGIKHLNKNIGDGKVLIIHHSVECTNMVHEEKRE